MTYSPARGLRGDFNPGRGDLTGAQYLRQQDEKDLRDKAIQATVNSMCDGTALVLVSVPHGPTFAIPRSVLAYLQVTK